MTPKPAESLDEVVIPANFGSVGGPEVTNKSTILAELDHALGREGPPDVEYLLVEPFAQFRMWPFRFGWGMSAYGHAAVRYRLPDSGQDVVMNISGKRGPGTMIHFTTPEDYLFSTKDDQKGIYNRSVTSLRVWDVEPQRIRDMHDFFLETQRKQTNQEAEFHIILGPVYNMFKNWFPGFSGMAERGNCARWVSSGLKRAGLTSKVSVWPKSIWINMFENYPFGRDNMSVVRYKRIKHAQLSYGTDAEPVSAVAPLQSMRSLFYLRLSRFADATVQVPPGSMSATVSVNDQPDRPNAFRDIVNHPILIGTSVVATFLLIRRHNYRFTNRLWNLRHYQPWQSSRSKSS